MAYEPWGYGDRWFDRFAARRRPGAVIAIFIVAAVLFAVAMRR